MENVQSDILALVAPEFHDEFLRFIETGEADSDFLDYLDRDADCQDAVELVLSTDDLIGDAIELIKREVARSSSETPNP